jgi:ABC-2 type transport system permease protein
MRAANAYFAVARTALSDRLAWRADVFLGAGMGAARVGLALVLWTAVFAGRESIGGMGLGTMASYYLIAVFAYQLDQSSAVSSELAGEIRSGRFGKYLARPVDPLAWFLAAACGRSLVQAAAALGAALALGLACILVDPAYLAPASALGLAAALPVLALGLLCLALVNYMTGILAFAFQDIGAFQIGKNCVVEFLSGALLPLALLPSGAREALELTPFPALASLPAELILGRGLEGYGRELALLALWALGLWACARALYASLSGRYEEMGS